MNGRADLSAFLRNGRMRLPFEYTRHVLPAMEGFERLMRQARDDPGPWLMDFSGQDDPDDGLILRDGGSYDHKWFFHYRPRIVPELRRRGVDLRPYQAWLDGLHELYASCQAELFLLAQDLDERFPGRDFARKALECKESVVRLLWYERVNYDRYIAQPHTDRSFITIHLADRYPGLEIGGELVETRTDDALLFSSQKLAVATAGAVGPVEHSAVLKDPGCPDKRWVAVFFGNIDMANLPSTLAAVTLVLKDRPRATLETVRSAVFDRDPVLPFHDAQSFAYAFEMLVRKGHLELAGIDDAPEGPEAFYRLTEKALERFEREPGQYRGIFRD